MIPAPHAASTRREGSHHIAKTTFRRLADFLDETGPPRRSAPRRRAHGGLHVATELKRRVRSREADASTDPLLALLAAMQAVRSGDFSVSLPVHWAGVEGKLAEAFNSIVTSNRRLAEDLQRVGAKVGREG